MVWKATLTSYKAISHILSFSFSHLQMLQSRKSSTTPNPRPISEQHTRTKSQESINAFTSKLVHTIESSTQKSNPNLTPEPSYKHLKANVVDPNRKIEDKPRSKNVNTDWLR